MNFSPSRLTLAALLASCFACGGADRPPSKAQLSQTLERAADATDSLIAFDAVERLNGIARPGGGGLPDRYDVEFRASLLVGAPLTLLTISTETPRPDFSRQVDDIREGYEVPFESGRRAVRLRGGTTTPVNGVVTFTRTEKGWELSELTMLLPDTLRGLPDPAPHRIAASAALRFLAVLQEGFKEDSGRYASRVDELTGWNPQAGIDISLTASASAFEAVATGADGLVRCTWRAGTRYSASERDRPICE